MRQPKCLIVLLFMALVCNLWAKEEENMRVQMQVGQQKFVFVLVENAAAQEVWNLLPLELRFSDYVGKEKVASLPKKLNAQESGDYTPQSGDFFYFAPWGKIGLYYAKQPPYPGLIQLGALESEHDSFVQTMRDQKQDFTIVISKIPDSH